MPSGTRVDGLVWAPERDVAYSLDGGDWVPVLPEDRIADALSETYRFSTPDLEPGEHTVTVKARDRAGNAAANKVVIRVGQEPSRPDGSARSHR